MPFSLITKTCNNEICDNLKETIHKYYYLGPLLLVIYKNDVHYAIKQCKAHHSADDINLLYFNLVIKNINKQFNYDSKNLIKANKVCLNVSKTEAVLFNSQNNK